MPVSTISFAQAVKQGHQSAPNTSTQQHTLPPVQTQAFSTTIPTSRSTSQSSRSTSPTPISEEQYVLTLLTTPAHHKAMTSLRDKYFPAKLNKLDAHVTLFHALPESKLETVIADVENVAREAEPVGIRVGRDDVFRMKRGVGIYVNESAGTTKLKAIHAELRNRWLPFLSDQDRGGLKAHYTIANKLSNPDEVDSTLSDVTRNLEEMATTNAKATTTELTSTVDGLTLWAYNKGRWKFYRDFHFGSEKGNA
jgi:mannose-1-phosphate guanylyltransferase